MTIDEETGYIFWTLTGAQFDSNLVTVKVEDGRGGITRKSFTVKVGTQRTNAAPSIDSVPPFTATTGQLYQYDLVGSDPDLKTTLSPKLGESRVESSPRLTDLGSNYVTIQRRCIN